MNSEFENIGKGASDNPTATPEANRQKLEDLLRLPGHTAEFRNKTIVLCFSGGLDSTAMLAIACETRPKQIIALSFNYGQKHFEREFEAAKAITGELGRRYTDVHIYHRLMDLSAVASVFRGSALTSENIEVPEGHYADETMRQTIVPNRNMIMLSIAAGVAVAEKAYCIGYAAHKGDHAVYPDCREPFTHAVREAIGLGNYHNVRMWTPFIKMTKSDIVSVGSLHKAPFSLSYSCYKGGELHCGKCGTCVERKEAFKDAGLFDVTDYEPETEPEKISINFHRGSYSEPQGFVDLPPFLGNPKPGDSGIFQSGVKPPEYYQIPFSNEAASKLTGLFLGIEPAKKDAESTEESETKKTFTHEFKASRGTVRTYTEEWTIRKSFTFEAAHRLPFHDGKCQRLHGHSFQLTVEISADKLQTGLVSRDSYKMQNAAQVVGITDVPIPAPGGTIPAGTVMMKNPKTGMVTDYADIKKAVKPLLEDFLDHHDLNQTTNLESPTSEALAKWIYDKLEDKLPGLSSITVSETCTSEATYQRNYLDRDDDSPKQFSMSFKTEVGEDNPLVEMLRKSADKSAAEKAVWGNDRMREKLRLHCEHGNVQNCVDALGKFSPVICYAMLQRNVDFSNAEYLDWLEMMQAQFIKSFGEKIEYVNFDQWLINLTQLKLDVDAEEKKDNENLSH